jgi:hypothetical protein
MVSVRSKQFISGVYLFSLTSFLKEEEEEEEEICTSSKSKIYYENIIRQNQLHLTETLHFRCI